MNELALFAGIGAGIIGTHLLGFRTVCAVEKEPFCREILLRRQWDGMLPLFPVWDDIRTFDGKPWCGKVDLITGGFPCQDISVAGKGKGLDGERSGLWSEMHRVICEVQPRYAFIENSPALIVRGLDRVLCDIAKAGYDAGWCVMGAHNVGAPHKRDRIWILAYSNQTGLEGSILTGSTHTERWEEQNGPTGQCGKVQWWNSDPAEAPESRLGRMVDGGANRMDRIKGLGNAQVPAVAATAFKYLMRRINSEDFR